MASDSRDVLARIDTEKESYLEELKDYIRIPSISTDPDFKDEVLRAADFLVGKMREAGLQAERIDTAGHIRWSTPSGWAPRASRRSSSTATTTCSPSIRWSPGATRPSSRRSRGTTSTRAAPPTTRGRCSPT